MCECIVDVSIRVQNLCVNCTAEPVLGSHFACVWEPFIEPKFPQTDVVLCRRLDCECDLNFIKQLI